jgi:hypothetical protein
MLAKPIDQIGFEDVDEFCRTGAREGLLLDYKADFPARLDKAIAAFANTYGGHILVGVGEQATSSSPRRNPVPSAFTPNLFYTEVNSLGLIYSVVGIGNPEDVGSDSIHCGLVGSALAATLRYALQLYKAVGYFGLV